MEQALINSYKKNRLLDNSNFNNRLAYILYLISFLVLSLSLGYYFAFSHFRINKIVVNGDLVNITKSDLDQAIHEDLYGTFFTADLNKLKTRIQDIPWVYTVSLHRIFPDQIYIEIDEHKALAIVNDNSLLSDNGSVFNRPVGGYQDQDLPHININDVNAKIAYNMLTQLNKILDTKNEKVTDLSMISSKILSFNISNRVNVVLCGDDLNVEVLKFHKYFDKLQEIRPEVSYMNFCYKDYVAIR